MPYPLRYAQKLLSELRAVAVSKSEVFSRSSPRVSEDSGFELLTSLCFDHFINNNIVACESAQLCVLFVSDC